MSSMSIRWQWFQEIYQFSADVSQGLGGETIWERRNMLEKSPRNATHFVGTILLLPFCSDLLEQEIVFLGPKTM